MSHDYKNIISIKNLCDAWTEFIRGKKSKKDVAEFTLKLSDNILSLHQDLRTKMYVHGSYEAFSINDPKTRNIHKATVRDRLLHHAVHRVLYPYFDTKFIHDSYSCRKDKGTHRALNRLRDFGRKVSKNNTQTCWILKCDIKKFFASINHKILIKILEKHIADKDTLWILSRIIASFHSGKGGTGLPLGNLTSQLLINIYMNEFDQWMKHTIKAKYYIRYADDFVILCHDKDYLPELVPQIADFLYEHLKLSLHPNKLFLKTLSSGVDFLGWVHFPYQRVLRTTTKRRMLKKLSLSQKEEMVASYVGLLSHGNGYKLRQDIKNVYQKL